MQPRRVVFEDVNPLVFATLETAAPDAVIGIKRPARLENGKTYIQYRNDAGPEFDVFRTFNFGVNCWAPTLRGAFATLARVQAVFRSRRLPTGARVVGSDAGVGPYEIVDDADNVDSHAHTYCTVSVTVRGVNFT